jgi:hypothetical protein
MTFTNNIRGLVPTITRKEYVELEARDKAARDAYYRLPREQREDTRKPAPLVVMRRATLVAIRTDKDHAEWRRITDATN